MMRKNATIIVDYIPMMVIAAITMMMPGVSSHGTMVYPVPRQPESLFWYQVGCMIGCKCSGGGKETYPSLQSVNCLSPKEPTLSREEFLTWNINNGSPYSLSKNDTVNWNKYMPWKSPGSSIPIDSCGIASGFDPNAKMQYPHKFDISHGVQQGMKGTELMPGPETVWETNSVVEAGFRLTINHGGGYQYRVCPTDKGIPINEECFQANPLRFADDKHTVILYNSNDDTNLKSKNKSNSKNITIDAVAVTEGVTPEGHEWRRLPIPACSCDLGTNCYSNDGSSNSFGGDVSTMGYASPKGPTHGHCATGLQFDAAHLHNGLWPEGYGYYVAQLQSKNGQGQKQKYNTKDSTCSKYVDESSCTTDGKFSGCKWFSSSTKNVCYYEASKGEEENEKDQYQKEKDQYQKEKEGVIDPAANNVNVDCSTYNDNQSLCEQNANGISKCTWYEDANKRVCYSAGRKLATEKESSTKKTQVGFGGAGIEDDNLSYDWMIIDKLIAPEEEGTYILQWRWDNEQTPQIWTTCADIKVVESLSSSSSSSSQFTVTSFITMVGVTVLLSFLL